MYSFVHSFRQEHFAGPPATPTPLLQLTGQQLIGLPLRAPNAILEVVYALPMLTILTNKGTGIVTSVPSDAPDDYMAMQASALQQQKPKPIDRPLYVRSMSALCPFYGPVPTTAGGLGRCGSCLVFARCGPQPPVVSGGVGSAGPESESAAA